MKKSKCAALITFLLISIVLLLSFLLNNQQRYESNLFTARAIFGRASEQIQTKLVRGAGLSGEESDFIIDCEISLATHRLIDGGFPHLSSGTERQIGISVENMRDELLSAEGARLVQDKINAIRQQLSSVDTSFVVSLIQHTLWRDRCSYCAVIAAIID